MSAPLVYVMGPSGAGKDAVLGRARELLSPGLPIVFAHRYITRPAEIGGENHVAVSPAEFALRRDRGLFAFHWRAHGNNYGIGREVDGWRAAGLAVVVSGSREHFLKGDGIDAETHPVLITATAERLAERLARRGREDGEGMAARLERGLEHEIADPRMVTITNDGALDEAAEAFVSFLATLQRSPAVRR